MQPRYELSELVDTTDLAELVRSFCRSLSIAGGIVRNPKPDEKTPSDRSRFSDWRLTPVVGFDRNNNEIPGGSHFCQAIRTLDYGDRMCLEGDLSHAWTAFQGHNVQCYHCPSMDLADMVAPIRVGGYHLANVYFGQLRRSGLAFETIWKRYQDLLRHSSNAGVAVSRSILETHFLDLRTEDETIGVHAIRDLLKHLADLISRKASREAGIKIIGEIASGIVSCFDLKQGLDIILQSIVRGVNFDSGTIWLSEGENLVPRAAIGWQPEPIKIAAAGVAGHVFRQREAVKCNMRSEVDRHGPPGNPKSRDMREIASYLGAPLILDNDSVGVISVVSKTPNIYCADDVKLIDLLARYTALYIKSHRETEMLLKIAREKTFQKLLDTVVTSAPMLVNGQGCSIFLRQFYRFTLPDQRSTSCDVKDKELKGLPAFLVASTELPTDLIGEAKYGPHHSEGLTAGVLASGHGIRIDGGKGARTHRLRKTHRDWVWICKYPSADEKRRGRPYYEDRPFLAVPIKNSAGLILGVIRIADASDGKTHFSDNDVAVLNACATELGSALEASSVGFFFGKISDGIKDLRGTVAGLDRSAADVSNELASLRRSIDKATQQKIVLPLSVFIGFALLMALPALIVAAIVIFMKYGDWYYRLPAGMGVLSVIVGVCCVWKRKESRTPTRR